MFSGLRWRLLFLHHKLQIASRRREARLTRGSLCLLLPSQVQQSKAACRPTSENRCFVHYVQFFSKSRPRSFSPEEDVLIILGMSLAMVKIHLSATSRLSSQETLLASLTLVVPSSGYSPHASVPSIAARAASAHGQLSPSLGRAPRPFLRPSAPVRSHSARAGSPRLRGVQTPHAPGSGRSPLDLCARCRGNGSW